MIPDRIMDKVFPAGDCWIFTGAGEVYGFVKVKGRQMYVHRYVCELAHGSCPPDQEVRHTCDQPRCVNPAHLLYGTHQQNIDDRQVRGRTARGAAAGNSKLTDAAVLAIQEAYVPGKIRQADLAEEYGVTQATVSKLLLGRTWAGAHG